MDTLERMRSTKIKDRLKTISGLTFYVGDMMSRPNWERLGVVECADCGRKVPVGDRCFCFYFYQH